MTSFENIELIYNQFFKLADEINSMIEKEDYESALKKSEYKNELIKKLSRTRKTVELTDENKIKLSSIEQKLKVKEQINIDFLDRLKHSTGTKLKETKNKLKMGTAYTIKTENKSGKYVDLSE